MSKLEFIVAIPARFGSARLPGKPLLLIAGVIPGAFVGARITLRSSDRFVRVSFAVLLAVVGIVLGLSELGGLG